MSARRIFATCVALLTLAACNTTDYLVERYEWRWGPDPALPRSDVQTVIKGQIDVLNYITTQAFGIPYEPAKYPDGRPVQSYDPELWFGVAEWGFNVGRQDCEIYLNYMFRMNREKQRDDGIIAGVSAATSAIVTATTHNPAKALSVLAASFGLATALNDAIFSSYLFTEAPGLISVKVKDLQDAYQQKIEKNQIQQAKTFALDKSWIVSTTTQTNSVTTGKSKSAAPQDKNTTTTTVIAKPILFPEDAYAAIQNYYHICLPHSIEGILLQAVADSSAKSSDSSNSSTPKLVNNAGTAKGK